MFTKDLIVAPIAINAAITIQSYWKILYKFDKNNLVHNDKFNKVIAGNSHFKISYWSLIHYNYYFLLAYFFDNIYLLTFLGIVWELVEDLASRYTKNKKSISKKHTVINHDNTISYTTWWAGSYQDIVMNSLGIGHALMVKNIPYFGFMDACVHIYYYNYIMAKLVSTFRDNYSYFRNNYSFYSIIFTLLELVFAANPFLFKLFPEYFVYMFLLSQFYFIYFIL
jgi:hypothetical protein